MGTRYVCVDADGLPDGGGYFSDIFARRIQRGGGGEGDAGAVHNIGGMNQNGSGDHGRQYEVFTWLRLSARAGACRGAAPSSVKSYVPQIYSTVKSRTRKRKRGMSYLFCSGGIARLAMPPLPSSLIIRPLAAIDFGCRRGGIARAGQCQVVKGVS